MKTPGLVVNAPRMPVSKVLIPFRFQRSALVKNGKSADTDRELHLPSLVARLNAVSVSHVSECPQLSLINRFKLTEMDRPLEMSSLEAPTDYQQYQLTEPSSTFLSLPMTFPDMDAPSEKAGLSTQSMRTSSFAMSDESKPLSTQNGNLESSQIRKAYSRPSSTRSKRNSKNNVAVQETDSADYYDEKDFGNTDR